jgi:protoporphyrinogen oxidase
VQQAQRARGIQQAQQQVAATGLRIGDEVRHFAAVAATAQVPIFRRLIPAAPQSYHDFLSATDYLGIVCPLLVLDKPLTGYWTLNIADTRFPFTGVIETTSYIDPKYVGGHHLVYLPKYTAPGSPLLQASDDEVKALWLENLQRMLPDFDRSSVRYFLVHRERYVEPLHGLNRAHEIPEIETPVTGLFLATTAQIYPALTNGESVARHARLAAEQVQAFLPAGAGVPARTSAATSGAAATKIAQVAHADQGGRHA